MHNMCEQIYTLFCKMGWQPVAKLWKQPRCPSTDEWIRKMWSIYTMEYYASIRKDESPTFAATWTGVEEIMLSEIIQAERVNYHMVSLICGA